MATYKPVARLTPPAAPAAPALTEKSSSGFSTTTALLIGGAVVLAGAAAVYFLRRTEGDSDSAPVSGSAVEESSDDEQPVKVNEIKRIPSNNKSGATGGAGRQADDDDEDGDVSGAEEGGELAVRSGSISKKELLSMLDEMFIRVSELQASLKGLHESGELSPDDIVEAHSEGIANIEKSLHTKYGITQDDLNEAYQEFDGDEEVEASLAKLQKLFTIGDADAEAPEGLTADDFLEKFQAQNRVMMEAVSDIVDDVKASGKSGQDAFMYFQQQLMTRLPRLEQEASQSIGLSQSEFMGAFLKFGNDPRILQASMEVQQFTQQKQMEIMAL